MLLTVSVNKGIHSHSNPITMETEKMHTLSGNNIAGNSTKPSVSFKLDDGTDYAKYGMGDTIPFTVRADISLDFYGYWTIEKVKSDFKTTCTCGKVFGADEDYDVHSYQSGHSSYT